MHNAYLILKSPGAHAVLIDMENILRWLRLSKENWLHTKTKLNVGQYQLRKVN